MALVAPDDGSLVRLVEGADTRPVSPLQRYVEDRFDGKAGAAWLDGQQVDLGTRASEMIGACLLYGAHVDLPTLSEDQWDAAGAAGFEHAARGEEGIRSALGELLCRLRRDEGKGGPQAALGRLFQWLQFNKSSKAAARSVRSFASSSSTACRPSQGPGSSERSSRRAGGIRWLPSRI
jgi:hypothetical protein